MARGFIPYSFDQGNYPAWEYKPCGAITPKIGMALTESSGNLAIATGTTAPTYISMFEANAALTAGTVIPVMRVNKDIIYDVEFSASAGSLHIGDRVTLHASNGLQVTATTSSGVAEIVAIDANGGGTYGHAKVRF